MRIRTICLVDDRRVEQHDERTHDFDRIEMY